MRQCAVQMAASRTRILNLAVRYRLVPDGVKVGLSKLCLNHTEVPYSRPGVEGMRFPSTELILYGAGEVDSLVYFHRCRKRGE